MNNKEQAQEIIIKELSVKLKKAEHDRDRYRNRIAELEKENARLLDSVETVQSNRCTTKCELTKKQLKQFAERLKEKFEHCVGDVYSANNIDEKIDETLEESLYERK